MYYNFIPSGTLPSACASSIIVLYSLITISRAMTRALFLIAITLPFPIQLSSWFWYARFKYCCKSSRVKSGSCLILSMNIFKTLSNCSSNNSCSHSDSGTLILPFIVFSSFYSNISIFSSSYFPRFSPHFNVPFPHFLISSFLGH
ncbi:hypothetical protein EIN_095680 [Entamoeba invadens IP1]|uniref:Uncharacterized protein n=1 Tax=Entamoeba invadens IP1 TaxID=370355 RepID=A0A0A1U644_ENTIV|nr:hypothetical protein EIN_095680 [Entamoeba invadens IP1]ELP87311.1 hypothetical protein EIN_095680 [Entamoeba invadens IP1]|eukprot:XP_004254082.1 hypothetical protein EIN_095680 [Entamoeba invadens IP1]